MCDGEVSTFSAHPIGAVAVAGSSILAPRSRMMLVSRRGDEKAARVRPPGTPPRAHKRKPKSARRVETLLAAVQVWTGRDVRQLTPIDLSCPLRSGISCAGDPTAHRAPLARHATKRRPQAGSGEGSPAGDPSSYRLAICSDTAPIRL